MKTSSILPGRWLALLGVVLACAAPRAADYHDSVVIVLDASGSMRGTLAGSNLDKMSAAKSALKEVLASVPASTHIGLLVFSSSNLKNDWVYPLGPRVDADLARAIDLPKAGSGTPLGQYIKIGADRLLQERTKQFGYGTYRLLIVTDGEAGDQNLVERYTPDVISRGITVDVIGVGMSARHTLATKVHSYRAANDPASLKRALADVFAEVSAAAGDTAQNAAFEMIAPMPAEMAAAVIQSLATSGNQPIGQQPPKTPATSAARTSHPSPAASAPTPPPGPATPSSSSRGGGFVLAAFFVVGLVFMIGLMGLVFILMKVLKNSRK